jgi:membrane-associated phospholipid phosphatase
VKPRKFWAPLDRAELPALEWVERVRFAGPIERATKVLTLAGEHGLIWYGVAGAAAAIDKPRRAQWLRAGATVAALYGANTALKFTARRQRPPIAEIGTETDLSFPSSHAVTSFAAAALFSEFAPSAKPLFYIGALNVTASRLHFCVHYPSDLIAGAAIGQLAGSAIAKRYFAPVSSTSENPAVI